MLVLSLTPLRLKRRQDCDYYSIYYSTQIGVSLFTVTGISAFCPPISAYFNSNGCYSSSTNRRTMGAQARASLRQLYRRYLEVFPDAILHRTCNVATSVAFSHHIACLVAPPYLHRCTAIHSCADCVRRGNRQASLCFNTPSCTLQQCDLKQHLSTLLSMQRAASIACGYLRTPNPSLVRASPSRHTSCRCTQAAGSRITVSYNTCPVLRKRAHLISKLCAHTTPSRLRRQLSCTVILNMEAQIECVAILPCCTREQPRQK